MLLLKKSLSASLTLSPYWLRGSLLSSEKILSLIVNEILSEVKDLPETEPLKMIVASEGFRFLLYE